MRGTEKKLYTGIALAMAVFCLVVTGIALAVNIKASGERQTILADSVANRLLSACFAVRDDLDVDTLLRYGSAQDIQADPAAYGEIRQRLRKLGGELGVDSIQLIRTVDGKCVVVADSAESDGMLFAECPSDDEQLAAFSGESAVFLADSPDGASTAAVPFYQNRRVAGVIRVEDEDDYLWQSTTSRRYDTILLTVVLGVSMAALLALVALLTVRMRRAQAQLEHLAHHDAVTGLPNRQYFTALLDEATRDGKPFALFFIDLDDFKQVNDTAGHDAGDRVLRQAGQLLAGFAGAGGFACRYGGDEFVLVNFGIETEEAAAQKAQALLGHGTPFSVGVALYPGQAADGETLLMHADTAMYHAKEGGKNTFRLYAPDMPPKAAPPPEN